MKLLDKIQMTLRDIRTGNLLPLHIDVMDSSLSRKWLGALNQLLKNNYHLEKNYCFLGFAQSQRNGAYILDQINTSIQAINSADLGYTIHDHFSLSDCLIPGPFDEHTPGGMVNQQRMNMLHRYFEDLQGVSGQMSQLYTAANGTTRWHIRQLNLLCHEFESWVLSNRKLHTAPEWQRPSQLMCWLHAPRFVLDQHDYELFGVDTINRAQGGVFVGVNKAVGKHHWEVFNDEGRSVDELTTSTLRSQTEAAGDFDIEWGVNPAGRDWQVRKLAEFRSWLRDNGFDPEDPALTIGHPQVAQIDLHSSFGTQDYLSVWQQLYKYLDVYSIRTSDAVATYDYHWSDSNFTASQVAIIEQGRTHELD